MQSLVDFAMGFGLHFLDKMNLLEDLGKGGTVLVFSFRMTCWQQSEEQFSWGGFGDREINRRVI